MAKAEEIAKASEAIQQANAAYEGMPVHRINEPTMENPLYEEKCAVKQLQDFVHPLVNKMDGTQTLSKEARVGVIDRLATVVALRNIMQVRETVQPAIDVAIIVGKLDTLQ